MSAQEYSLNLTAEELRAIITGETAFRKCPTCGGAGSEWVLHYSTQDDPDTEIQKYVDAQFCADYAVDDNPDHSYGECFEYDCTTCHSVGFISNELDF